MNKKRISLLTTFILLFATFNGIFAEEQADVVIIQAEDPGGEGLKEALDKAGDICYTIDEKDFKVSLNARKKYPFLRKTFLMQTFRYMRQRLSCSPGFGEFGLNRVKGRAYLIGGSLYLELSVINYKQSELSKGDIVTVSEEFKSESPILMLDRLIPRMDQYILPQWKKADFKQQPLKTINHVVFNLQAKNGEQFVNVKKGAWRKLFKQNGQPFTQMTKNQIVTLKEIIGISVPENPFNTMRIKSYAGTHRFMFRIVPQVMSRFVLNFGRFRKDSKVRYQSRLIFYEHDGAKDLEKLIAEGKLKGTGLAYATGAGVQECVGVDLDDFYVAPNAKKAYPWLGDTIRYSTYRYLKNNLSCEVPINGFSTHKITGAAYVVKGHLRIEMGVVRYTSNSVSKEKIVNSTEDFIGKSPLLLIDEALTKTRQYIPPQYLKSPVTPEPVEVEAVDLNVSVAVDNLGKKIFPKITYVRATNVMYPQIKEDIMLEDTGEYSFMKERAFNTGEWKNFKGFNEINLNILDPEKTRPNVVLGKFPKGAKASSSKLPVYIFFRYWKYEKWKLPLIKVDKNVSIVTETDAKEMTSTPSTTETDNNDGTLPPPAPSNQ